jgi:hypothetical protein
MKIWNRADTIINTAKCWLQLFDEIGLDMLRDSSHDLFIRINRSLHPLPSFLYVLLSYVAKNFIRKAP